MLISLAGVVLVGAPLTGMPAAHRMASMMSDEYPPHLPTARIGWIFDCQLMPVMPWPLFDAAAMIPATAVPCQVLLVTGQPANVPDAASAAVTQSPGSVLSLSRPSPSLLRVALTKS